MASGITDGAYRIMSRVMRFFGTNNSAEISDSRRGQEETAHFGMFSVPELRHLDGVLQNNAQKRKDKLSEDAIITTLSDISSNTRKTIDELKHLKIMAPEIDHARMIIVSSIISPLEMQTDSVAVQVNHPGLDATVNAEISSKLTTFFNDEYSLGPKLADWLGCAGFEEGAKPILVLPKHSIDVLNVIADKWDPDTLQKFNEAKKNLENSDVVSTESLVDFSSWHIAKKSIKREEGVALESNVPDLDDLEIPEAFSDLEASMETLAHALVDKSQAGKEHISVENAGDKKELYSSADQLAKALAKGAFKLLKTSDNHDAVTITRDVRQLLKVKKSVSTKVDEMVKEAMALVRGFNPDDDAGRPALPVYTVSDVIKTAEKDMPIVIEFPCDSVIPVCAPRDNKNHIGYYILLDENGQPARGNYVFNGGVTTDAVNRLATNAAKSVYGGVTLQTYKDSGVSQTDVLQQMTQVFAVAVNHLLEAKLRKQGLTGLDVHVHEAVGKCLFFNLLAKNKIKLVFVPAPMMTYIRFAHREDGTGKTFLEDIAYLLGLRVTLTIAKLMAAVDNATKHRRIEVNVDEKNQNVLGTLNIVRNAWMAKKVPQITTDPSTAAESILNQHLSIVPKGLIGNTDDLNITTETSYGQSQAPDQELMDTLNNWIGIALKVPPSVLNQLSEAEYSRSVATSNLFFSNCVRNWQNMIKPQVKIFLVNYILSHDQLLNDIRKIIHDVKDGKRTETKVGIEEAEKDDPKETTTQDPGKDDDTEEALKRVISTVELILPPPNMVGNKAHFEEINSQVDAIDKILESIYNDDVAPNDEVRSLMASVRAVAKAKLLRDFLPRLGFHEIADIPDIEEISTEQPAKLIMFLNNFKRRMDNIAKMGLNQLADQQGGNGGAGGSYGETSTSTDTGSEGGEGEGGEEEGGEEGGEGGGGDELNFDM